MEIIRVNYNGGGPEACDGNALVRAHDIILYILI